MPVSLELTQEERKLISTLIRVYTDKHKHISLFLDQLRDALISSEELAQYIHSIKWRIKDPDHLKDKLIRKIISAKNDQKPFDITEGNILVRVNDLAGIRILHLYTRQIRNIDKILKEIFSEMKYDLIEGPIARTWDDESRAFFKECGITTKESDTMYTSVHYVVGSASRTQVTCEIQVRTLMEEVWGEVDHKINYPHQCKIFSCREQIKVLARVTSSATRLVDSIFSTLEDHTLRKRKKK